MAIFTERFHNMIGLKSTYNKIKLLLFIIAGVILIVLSILAFMEYRLTKIKIEEVLPSLFNQAIDEEVKLKMEDEYVFMSIKDPFSTNKKTGNQRLIMKDTVVTKEVEVRSSVEKELMKGSQSYLLHVNRLQPDTLKQLLDEKLRENGIEARAVITIRHNHDTHISGDTTEYRINYRTPVIKGGAFDEITYQALLDYSPFAVFLLMSKNMLFILLALLTLMIGMIIFLYIKKKEIKPDRIIKKGRYYYIGEIPFDTRTNELIKQSGESVSITKLPASILLMFLENEEHVLYKKALKDTFWPKSDTADQSMTNAIYKLRSNLKEAGCTFNSTLTDYL